MIKKSFLWRFLCCQILLFSLASFCTLSAQTGPNDDFDGDGIINSIDLDDDNDGVPDAVESPLCYYTASEWNTLAKPTVNGVTVSSALTTTTGNFSQLLDGVNNVTAVTFSASPVQPIQNANVYLFTFAKAVKLNALYLKFNTATQFGGTTKIQGSNTNNGSDWVDLSAAVGAAAGPNVTVNGSVSVTTSIKYPVTLNTAAAYKYIRITGVAASNIAAQNASEVYFDFNTAEYVASFYPKASCTNDTDGDTILNHFDLNSDNDNASDALEAGATTVTTPNYQFPNIDSNGDGLVDAVDANNDGIPNYNSSYYPNAINAAISPLNAEICNDGIDNDGDGRIDGYDSNCYNLATCVTDKFISNFEIQNTACAPYGSASAYQTPMVADIDRDGIADIISFNDANTTIAVLNSTTLVPKFSIPAPEGNFGARPNSLAIGQLDGSGYLEIAYVTSTNKVAVLRYNGTAWQSFLSPVINSTVLSSGSAYTNGLGIADFDQDGTPELYLGNQIFSVNFSCTTGPCITNVINGMTVGTAFGNIGVPGGGISFAYDILPASECALCSGLEIIAGNQIYAVNVATGQVELARNFTGSSDANLDGPTAIADINLDGLMDVVVSNIGGSIYAWTPQTNQLIMDLPGNGGAQRPLPFISNVYDDDLADDGIKNNSKVNYPEIIVLVGTTLTAYNAGSAAPLYTLATTDGSAATSMVAFDFNGDGNKEIVYRDETTLRILYGGPMAYAPSNVAANRNYASFACSSGTGWEHPIVADIDNDGEAEIVQSCGGNICIFESVSHPWMPARPIWNQLSYNIVNVNDDGSIPQYQQDILASFNGAGNDVLNQFNTQLNPLEVISPEGFIAAPDISVGSAAITNLNTDGIADCSNINIQYQIDNTGSAAMENKIYIYVYDKDPRTVSTASLIYQTQTNQNIPAGSSITQTLQFGIPPTSLPVNNIYIAVNTNPDMTVLVDQSDFLGSYPECNYANNIFEFAIPGCLDTDGDGITDSVDLDDDNDGILDAIESPSCFYTASEAVVPVMISTGIAGSTVNSVAVAPSTDIPTMHDNITTTVAASNHIIPANQLGTTSTIIYKVQYPTAIGLTQMVVHTATASWGTGSFAVLEGSNDDVSYTAVSAPVATSAGSPKIWPVTLNVNNLYRYYRIRVSTVGSTQPTFTNYEVVGTVNTATYNPSASPKPINCLVDTDGDGFTNHRDLDSDGDGCPDAVEAGVSRNAGTAGSMSASGGSIYSGGIASGTANAYVGNGTTSQYGANGYFNGIETSSESGVYNGTSTYSQYALNNTLNYCLDTDGDGIPDIDDIDDDNDGVLDTSEQNCPNGSKTGVIVTKPSTINYNMNGTSATNTLADLVDGVDANVYVMYNPTGTLSNAEWFRVEFPYARILSSWEVAHYSSQTLFSITSTYKVQGSNDANVWTDLTGTLTYSRTQSGQSTQANNSNVANFSSNQTAYKYYRYYGISGSVGTGWATEFYFQDNSCVDIDTDNDGIPNRLDLDSDNDGCPDAVESSVSANTGASGSMSASGGAIYSGGIATGTANAYVGNGTSSQYGTNGFFNGIETSSDSGVYNGVYTYTQYALSNNVSLCADTDGDGINDITDIDDDNDGILDAVESPACFYTSAEAGVIASVSTALVNDDGTNVDLPFMHDGVATSVTASNNVIAINEAANGAVIYNIDYPTAVKLTSITHAGTTFGTNATAKIQGSNDKIAWDELMTAPTAATANPKTFTVNNNTANSYRYYRIVKVAGTTTPAITSYEVSSVQNTAGYVPSAHPKPTCATDFDGDGIFNHLDSDSDNDGCSDAFEAGTAAYSTSNGGTVSSGTLDNPTSSVSPNATVGSNASGDYGVNGFYNILETSENGVYLGTYTYANAINNAIANCIQACYRPAVVAGTALDTRQGITSLQRAGSDNDNWPMVRKGAWTALESKTKGFVPNRLTAQQITDIPAANLREGMMVYNITSDCLYINTDGTPTGWKCFNTQACPD